MVKNILIITATLACISAQAGTVNAPNTFKDSTKLILLKANENITKLDITNATYLISLAEKRNPLLVKETGIKKKLKILKKFINACKDLKIKPDINKATEKIWENQLYEKALLLYKAHKELNLKLTQDNIIKLAMILAWSNHLKEAENILEEYKNKEDRNYIELKLKICNWNGNYDCSKKYLNRLLKYYPDSQSYKLAFDTFLNYGELEKAEQIILTGKRKFPGKMWNELLKRLEAKREELIKSLEKKYNENPTWKNCIQLAYLLYTSGRKEDSIKLLKNYLHKHPNDEKALATLAEYLSWAGKLDEAENLYERLFRETNKLYYLLMKIRLLEWNSRFDRAKELLESTEKRKTLTARDKAEIYKLFGYLYLWQNKNDKALHYFKLAEKENPKDEETKEEIMLLTGKFKSLLKKYTNLIKKKPEPYYFRRLGDIYSKMKQYRKALKYYLKYLELNPEDINILRDIGELYIKIGNYQKGFSYLEFYANKINTVNAKLTLAKNYYWAGFPEAALQVIEEILESEPGNREALDLKAKILSETPRFQIGKRPFGTTNKFTETAKWKILAERLQNGGFTEEAAKAYEKYLTFYPEDPEAMYNLAKTLEKLGRFKEAAAEWFLFSWYRNDSEVLFHYARCLANSGKKKEAEKFLKQIIALKPPPEILAFINQWKKAWEERNFQKYASFYAKAIKTPYWTWKKKNLFKENNYIKIQISNIKLKSQKGNRYTIQFWQKYSSPKHSDEGLKTLVLQRTAPGKFIIVSESWQKGKKSFNLDRIIKEAEKLLNSITKQKKNRVKTRKSRREKNQTIEEKTEIDKKLIDKISARISLLKSFKPNTPEFIRRKSVKKERTPASPRNTQRQLSGTTLIDSDNVILFTTGYQTSQGSFSGKIEGYYLRRENTLTGFELSTSLNKPPFTYGITFDISNCYKNIYPSITYSNKKIGLSVSLFQKSIARERLSVTAAKENRIGTFVKSTLYRKINRKELWSEIQTGYINDGNISTIFQFSFTDGREDISPVVKGWYISDSRETTEYYSPRFFDSTLVGLKKTILYKGWSVEPEIDVGYSFREKLTLGEISLKTGQRFWNARLTFSNLRVTTLSRSRYWYINCEVTVNGF
ncbi:tetratricopeptide repeat protein [Desulfurobacterium sp.]